MDAKETSEVERTADADIKQEPVDSEPPDGSTDTMHESMTKIGEEIPPVTTVKEDNNLEHTINSDFKQEPTADMELMKGAGPWEGTLQQLPTYTHSDIKQEPKDNDQIDPDDVTTQLIPEASEQHELEDIKYVNIQDYMDIGETVISNQDRERPGPSSKGDVKLKPKTTRLLAGRKQFECDICGYQNRRRGDFETHVRKHTGEKPYKCGICVYKSGDRRLLKRHIRTHTGEKPYKCEICDYQCRQLCNLKIHLTRHTGEKKAYRRETV